MDFTGEIKCSQQANLWHVLRLGRSLHSRIVSRPHGLYQVACWKGLSCCALNMSWEALLGATAAVSCYFTLDCFLCRHRPGDFRSWESPQTLPALFIGPFEHVEQFRNLKFSVERITNIQSTVLSSSQGTATIHLAFK